MLVKGVTGLRLLYLLIIIKSEVWPVCHCLGFGHEAMVWATCLSIFSLWYTYLTLRIRLIINKSYCMYNYVLTESCNLVAELFPGLLECTYEFGDLYQIWYKALLCEWPHKYQLSNLTVGHIEMSGNILKCSRVWHKGEPSFTSRQICI